MSCFSIAVTINKKTTPCEIAQLFKKYTLLHNLTVFALFLSESVKPETTQQIYNWVRSHIFLLPYK